MISLDELDKKGVMKSVKLTEEQLKEAEKGLIEGTEDFYKSFAASQRRAKSKYFGVRVLD